MSNVIDFQAALNARRVAAAIAAREEAERQREAVGKYAPAYCDPANLFVGCKYDSVKGMRIVDVAKRVREDIKALKLDKGFKISVRSDARSIDVRVVKVPAGFKFWSVARAAWFKQFGDRRMFPGSNADQRSAEYLGLKGKLEAIRDAYQRDNSDISSDYFDVNFYGSVEFEGDWAALKAEAEEAPVDYWADNAGA